MISEIERNYTPRTWTKLDIEPQSREYEPFAGYEFFYFCNADSQRFQNLLETGSGEKAVLLDYELLSLDLDPLCGSMVSRFHDGSIYLIVFTKDGNKYYREVLPEIPDDSSLELEC